MIELLSQRINLLGESYFKTFRNQNCLTNTHVRMNPFLNLERVHFVPYKTLA